MNDPINPPAITRTAVKELIVQGKASQGRLAKGKRQNLMEYLILGKIVQELKEACAEIGQYTEALKEMAVPKQTAWEAREMYQLPPEAGISSCASISEGRQCMEAWKAAHPKVDTSCPVGKPDDHSSQTSAESKLIPDLAAWVSSNGITPKLLPRLEALPEWKQEALLARLREGKHVYPSLQEVEGMNQGPPASVFCPDCKEKGPKKDCQACATLRSPGRQPGDEEEKPKGKTGGKSGVPPLVNGSEEFELRQFHAHLSIVMRDIDLLAWQAGFKGKDHKGSPKTITNPQHQGLHRRLTEVRKAIEEIDEEIVKWHQKSRKKE